MTTLAAVAFGGRVVMGADSMTNVYDRPVCSVRKIRRFAVGAESVLIGCCGDGALPDALEAGLSIDALPMRTRENGLTKHGRTHGTMLLGARGELWTICHRHAIHHPDGVAALGSGEGPAIGALDALFVGDVLDLAMMVRRAVEIGIARDKHSDGPVQVEEA